jgi:hypothetical protein
MIDDETIAAGIEWVTGKARCLAKAIGASAPVKCGQRAFSVRFGHTMAADIRSGQSMVPIKAALPREGLIQFQAGVSGETAGRPWPHTSGPSC